MASHPHARSQSRRISVDEAADRASHERRDQAEGTSSCDLAFYFEAADYERSVRRIADLSVETIIAGHPFKPFPSAVMRGTEARRLVEVSRSAHVRYQEQVAATLRRAQTRDERGRRRGGGHPSQRL